MINFTPLSCEILKQCIDRATVNRSSPVEPFLSRKTCSPYNPQMKTRGQIVLSTLGYLVQKWICRRPACIPLPSLESGKK